MYRIRIVFSTAHQTTNDHRVIHQDPHQA